MSYNPLMRLVLFHRHVLLRRGLRRCADLD